MVQSVPTDKPRHTLSLSLEADKIFVNYCEERGLNKSDVFEQMVTIMLDPSRLERLEVLADKAFRSIEHQILMYIEEGLQRDERST